MSSRNLAKTNTAEREAKVQEYLDSLPKPKEQLNLVNGSLIEVTDSTPIISELITKPFKITAISIFISALNVPTLNLSVSQESLNNKVTNEFQVKKGLTEIKEDILLEPGSVLSVYLDSLTDFKAENVHITIERWYYEGV